MRDPATESQFDYGSRAAIWRVMRSFKKHEIPITFYAVARAFERNLAVAKYAEENGHEVASHCYKVNNSRTEKYHAALKLPVETVQWNVRRGRGGLHQKGGRIFQGYVTFWKGASRGGYLRHR